MLLLRAHVLALGHSGVRPEVVDRLIEFLNEDVLPIVPEQGSLGASGDLAPLAHLALPLIGEGEVSFEGERMPGWMALERAGPRAADAGGEGGPALINGTQGMLAIGILAAERARSLAKTADIAAAMTHRGRPGHGPRRSTSGCRRSVRTPVRRLGREPAPAARRQRDPRLAPRQPASGAGRVLAALRAAGPRGVPRRPGVRRGACS